jgi:prolyl-tRNA synthetase
MLIPTLREDPSEAETNSHRFMVRAGMIRQLAAGIYAYLPLAYRVLGRVERMIREEMEKAGAAELLLPALHPAELWQESGRWDVYGDELIRLSDRHGRRFALGPTHEETITALVRNEINSYKKLPLILYQIQTKFRDERRPRGGLLRGRELIMKDAYSFHASAESLDEAYRKMYDAYTAIFSRCGLTFRALEADSGAIGGTDTHEFIALSETGEDTILHCPGCGYAANLELAAERDLSDRINPDLLSGSSGVRCSRCKGMLQSEKGIEIGHIFKLGTKYSEALGASFLDDKGRSLPFIMGCYGIGVSRLLAAVAEQHHDEAGIIWPAAIAPFQVHLIAVQPKQNEQAELAERVYIGLKQAGIDVLFDDRDERPGVKFADADLIGIPYRVTIGKRAAEGIVECKRRGAAETFELPADQLLGYIGSHMN